MAHRGIILLLLLAINFKVSWSLALNCTYGMQAFPPIGSIYTCQAGILSGGSDIVTDMYGIHQNGKTHSDVHGIALLSHGLEFFPLNIESFFPNIRAVDVYSNLITSISNSHLKPFTNLVHFSAIDNKIDSLDSNLFLGLPFLSYVSFSNNTIKHVGHDFILPNNGQIFFDMNYCIDQTAVNAPEIENLRFNLLRKCPPTISQIEDTLEDRRNLLTNLAARVAYLEAKIEALLAFNGPNYKH